MKVLSSMWFNSLRGECIGLVLVDAGAELKAYLGSAMSGTEDADVKHICSFGAKFPVDAAKIALGYKG